jgi:hypothetical protein
MYDDLDERWENSPYRKTQRELEAERQQRREAEGRLQKTESRLQEVNAGCRNWSAS